jgi:hypothetical protein
MRITFGLPGLGGAVSSLPTVYQSLRSLLDWKGRYDAGVSVVSATSSYVPEWIYPVTLIVAILLIWWDSRRQKKEFTIVVSPLAIAVVATIAALGSGPIK